MNWSRREFIKAGAAAGVVLSGPPLLSQEKPHAQDNSAGKQSLGVRPLLRGHTERPLRYRPDGSDFVIENGVEFFNRPLYGPNTAFRSDGGDKPEFTLYLPGRGGNLRLGVKAAGTSKWLFDADHVVTRYRPGALLYEIHDPLLSGATLRLHVVTMSESEGLMVRAESEGGSAPVQLIWAYGGVNGEKGARGGDIGCERVPVSEFFQFRPEYSAGNQFTIDGCVAHLESQAAAINCIFPTGSKLEIADGRQWQSWSNLSRSASDASSKPDLQVLIGEVSMQAGQPLFIALQHPGRPKAGALSEPLPGAAKKASLPGEFASDPMVTSAYMPEQIPAIFASSDAHFRRIAETLVADTPDPYINAAAGAIPIALNGIWDAPTGTILHGAVAWRVRLAGWRGPYAFDDLGWHDKIRHHLRYWMSRQNVSGFMPRTGEADAAKNLATTEMLLHSDGDVSNNHYDMNLVCFDALLRHIMWTGDMEFAREVWPNIERHLAWERRLFRREYGPDKLPLYEAYACIWASDNLQYNGGGATHSTAYNYFQNRTVARLAAALGEDGRIYTKEADLILLGMQQHLWMKDVGCFGESKDFFGDQVVHPSPALWTYYHAVDCDVPTPIQAYQMRRDFEARLVPVPVHGPGVPAGDFKMLSCSDWMPYMWSLNLLLMAENMHTALACWKSDAAGAAFDLFKGNLLDSMYMGLCPGDVHMTSALSVHRQEAQRDFGDPLGMTSRAFIEGLFGVRPDLIAGRIDLAPGFPAEWDHASLRHADFNFSFLRQGETDTYRFDSKWTKPVDLHLRIAARKDRIASLTMNGQPAQWQNAEESVGAPKLVITGPTATTYEVKIAWKGNVPASPAKMDRMKKGDALPASLAHANVLQLLDPQGALIDSKVVKEGHSTVFAKVQQGELKWWMPMDLEVEAATQREAPAVAVDASECEPVNLDGIFNDRVTRIFRNEYLSPRSHFCSLSLPRQGIGGWAGEFNATANIDDSGLRAAAEAQGGFVVTPYGVRFRTQGTNARRNIAFASQWDNFPKELTVPLTGSARSIYLLMAGSTTPQESRMENALATAHYADGSSDSLSLRNPNNWWPIEQDYLIDDFQFARPGRIPMRLHLKTGKFVSYDEKTFKGQGRTVDGGAATVLVLPVDPAKQLASLTVRATAFEVIVGLMAATLVR